MLAFIIQQLADFGDGQGPDALGRLDGPAAQAACPRAAHTCAPGRRRPARDRVALIWLGLPFGAWLPVVAVLPLTAALIMEISARRPPG